jgi:NADPH:quinone reductase-like Zn-dependent oxidoreductase
MGCIVARSTCAHAAFRSPRPGPTIDGMKTLLFRDRISLDDLVLVERPIPSPGPREVLLRMRAASLNFRDLAIARDGYGGLAAPLVPISDGAGEVVAKGAGVTRFAVGDLVCPAYVVDWIDGPLREEVSRRRLGGSTDGVLSEYVVVHEDAAVRAPSHLDAVEASTLPIAAVTVWQALFADAGVRAGDTIAVQGTGGVSLFVVLLARAAGARVLVVTRGGERASRVERMGAVAIDALRDPAWEARVLELTRGRGVDVFVDVVGGEHVARAVLATRVGGTVALVGFVGATVASLDIPLVLRRAVTLRAASAGSRASFEALVRAMETTGVRPTVDRIVPFLAAREAYRVLEEGRPFGKVVIAFDEAAS